jgi:hypothetical protein
MVEAHPNLDTEDAMPELRNVEGLLRDAIGLLEDNGFPLAAESLRDNLRAIRIAPTAGARRRRLFQLRDLLEGMGSTLDVFFCTPGQAPHGLRFRRTESNRRDQERYRRTLEAIQGILALGRHEDAGELQVA